MPDLLHLGFIATLVIAAASIVALKARGRENLRLTLERDALCEERDDARAEATELNRALQALPDLERGLENVSRQRDGLRSIIEEVQSERDVWRRLYYSQGTGHDNAQRWMMREIETLSRQVASLGGKPQISPTLPTVRAEFEREHEQPLNDYRSGRADAVHAETTKQENARVREIDPSP